MAIYFSEAIMLLVAAPLSIGLVGMVMYIRQPKH